jgi:Tfp pilus assembly protein PilO
VTAIQKLDLSPRALVLALLGTLVVLMAATWFILVAPKHSKAKSLDSQIETAQTQLSIRQRAAHKAAHVASEAVRARRAMPDTVAMPQIVLELSRVATEEHVSIDGITPAPATPFAGFEQVPLTVIVSGKFFDVEGFLHELRNQVRVASGNIFATGRLFDVQGVNLAVGTPAPKVSATLNLNAFVYSGVPLAPAAPTTTTAAS